MELTIQIPWLTRMRRMAISLSLVLLLVAVALPASAAAPEGIEGEVTVVNGAEQPVPITGDVTANVTGSVNVAGTVTVDNEATDPVPVSGDVTADVTGSVAVSGTVAATQSGDWTVGLDSASQGHLSDIDAATAPLSYDADGNLNVNLAAGTTGGGEAQTAGELASTSPAGLAWPAGDFHDFVFPSDSHVTAFSVYASESVFVEFFDDHEFGIAQPFSFRVDAGETLALSFPFPFVADRARIQNLSSVDQVFVWFSVSGY